MKKFLSLLLALTLCLGLVPAAASAAEAGFPDWYFLFAVFKNVDTDYQQDGVNKHTQYSMTQEEVNGIREDAQAFEAFMNQVGVMRAHVDVVEIDAVVTELEYYDAQGGYISSAQAEPLLREKVDLDRYDHVTCVVSLNFDTSYFGLGGTSYSNGTGHTCINLKNREQYLYVLRPAEAKFPPSVYVHEFLHFMENTSKAYNAQFDLHRAGEFYNTGSVDNWKGYYTDTLQNHAKGGYGTGVSPAVWQFSPRTLRSIHEVNIPSGVTGIGGYAFQFRTTLNKVTIPSTAANIGYFAFGNCTGLTEVVMLPGVASLEDWAFGECSALAKVTIPDSVTSIGYAAFYNSSLTDVYYSGTEEQWRAIQIGEFNESLTNANIHYNSVIEEPSASVPSVTVDQIPTKGTAYAYTQNITIDGRNVKFDTYALKNENGDLTNYVKLRDIAVALNGTAAQFEVGYDGTISLTAKTAYTGGSEMGAPFSGDRDYQGGAQPVKVNGRPVDMTAITLYDGDNNGYNYFKLRDLGDALGFEVGWTAGQGIFIETE